MEWRTDGLILRAIDYKENDKILTILTPLDGKITAGIRGVRKPKAKLAFAAQPFCFAEYVLAKSGDRNTVVSAYLYDGFYPVREDIVRYYAACAAMEICDVLTDENVDVKGLFVGAVECLKDLALTEGDCAEIFVSFALVALRESGYAIDLDGCRICGAKMDETPYFDLSSGQFTCGGCAVGVRAKKETYEFLRKCSGFSYEESNFSESGKRALKLIRAYLIEKTDEEYPCLGEFIKLY